jgi:nucleotide-binding universal stress UspA family protein
MKLLAAIDFSDTTAQLLAHCSRLCEALQAEIYLIHVAEPNPDHIAYDYDPAAVYTIDPSEIRDSIAERFHQQHRDLQQYAEEMRAKGIQCTALMIQGPTVDSLLKEADKLKTDFMVAGTHGKGLLSRVLLGSTSEELVRRSSIPVHLVPTTED